MKDKKILIAVIAFAIVLLLTVGATYAYFTATATTDTTAETVNVKTAELGITYAHGTGVNLENLTLTADHSSYVPFSVTNNGTLDQTFQVMWDTITTNTIVGFANQETDAICNNATDDGCQDVRHDFIWTLYELPTAFNAGNPETSIAAGQMMGEAYLYSATSDSIIVPNLLIASGATKNYVLRINFNYYGENDRVGLSDTNKQDYQQGKQFTGTIKVDNVEMYTPLASIGTTTDWQVSAATNASGGYTLEAFTGSLDNSQNVRVVEDYFNDSNTSRFFAGTGTPGLSELTSNDAYIIQIPISVDGKTITELSSNLFSTSVQNNDAAVDPLLRIKEVIIPEGVVTIQNGMYEQGYVYGSFLACANIDKISLPNSLISVGDYAFLGIGLYELKIPANLQVLGNTAFYTDFGEKLNLVIPNNSSLTKIGNEVFATKHLTGTIIIPASVQSIGRSAFAFNNISSIVFAGNNVIEIDEQAFASNDLTGVFTIPQSVTTIGEKIFDGNTAITSINFVGRSSLNGMTLDSNWNREDSHPNAIIPHTFTP